jgi:hypothetical protein
MATAGEKEGTALSAISHRRVRNPKPKNVQYNTVYSTKITAEVEKGCKIHLMFVIL